MPITIQHEQQCLAISRRSTKEPKAHKQLCRMPNSEVTLFKNAPMPELHCVWSRMHFHYCSGERGA